MRKLTLVISCTAMVVLAAAAANGQTNEDPGGDTALWTPRTWINSTPTLPGTSTPGQNAHAGGVYLGRLSTNPYAPDSVANPYGRYGSPYSQRSIRNPYSTWGSEYSNQGVTNPYATRAPKLYAKDGTYLGRLSKNPYRSDSVSNPYGRYGSPYSPTGINNPYGVYGSPYSQLSPNNPYSQSAPVIVGED